LARMGLKGWLELYSNFENSSEYINALAK